MMAKVIPRRFQFYEQRVTGHDGDGDLLGRLTGHDGDGDPPRLYEYKAQAISQLPLSTCSFR